MLTFTQHTNRPATDFVTLSYDERVRSRLKVQLRSGVDAGIVLERGDQLHDGDRLLADDGATVVEVKAAPEQLTQAHACTPMLFARAAYHLGNRHVAVQMIPDASGGRLLFQADHVLAEMVESLGCVVSTVQAPFQPESGAYGSQHHAGHSHGNHSHTGDGHHSHSHDALHAHPPGHSADGEGRGARIHEFR